MKASVKAGLALVALFALGLGWWALEGASRPAAENGEATAPAESGHDGAESGPSSAPRARARSRAPAEAATAAPAVPATTVVKTDGAAQPSPAEFPEGAAAPGEVVGRVLLLPDRTPARGAVVRLQGSIGNDNLGPAVAVESYPEIRSATTGANGVFRLGGFVPGTYVFAASLEGRTDRRFTATVPVDGGAGGIEVLIGTGGTIEGRVSNTAGLSVRISPGGGSRSPDVNGDYRFEDLPSGNYQVHLAQGPHRSRRGRAAPVREHQRHVVVTAGEVVRVDFTGEAAIVGSVMLDGSSLPDAYVRATRRGPAYEMAQTRTGPDGAFRIEGLDPAEYTICVQVLGDAAFAADVCTATLRAGENRLDLRVGEGDLAGEISGRVLAKATGAPLTHSEVQITLHVLDEQAEDVWTLGRSVGMAFANARGEFRLRAVPPGRYRLVLAALSGRVRGTDVDLDLERGQKRTGVEIALEPATPRPAPLPSVSTLSGTLTDAEARPVGGADVWAYRADDANRGRRATTDPSGRFRILRLEPATWRVYVQIAGPQGFSAELAEVVVVAGDNALDLRLDHGDLAASVRGRVYVRSSGDAPAKYVQLGLFSVPSSGEARYVGSAQLDPRGRFCFRSVRAGRFQVRAFPVDGSLRSAAVDIVLVQGEILEGVEVPLESVVTGRVCFVVRDEAGKPVPDAVFQSSRRGAGEPVYTSGDSDAGIYLTDLELGRHVVNVRDFKDTLHGEATVEAREGETTKVEVVLRPKP